MSMTVKPVRDDGTTFRQVDRQNLALKEPIVCRNRSRYTSGLFIPLQAACSWPSADQLSMDVFGHDRFELFFAPRQPRHNRADWYFESFGNLSV